jgi:hypothetical protein
MNTTAHHYAYPLTLLTAALLTVQTITGVFVPGLYRDASVWVTSVLRGQDAVALCLVLPVLLVSAFQARRGSAAWRIAWIGTLYKIFYNNLYYLTGTDFNRAFLLYPALFISSALAIAFALHETAIESVQPAVWPRGRTRLAAGILFASAAILTIMWVGQSLAYVVTGQLPQLIVDGGGGTHLVAAFDLTCVVPLAVLGGVWLLRQRPWAYVVAGGMLVQGLLIIADLLVTPAFQAAAGVKDAYAMVPVWCVMGAGFLAGATALLRRPGLRPAGAPQQMRDEA